MFISTKKVSLFILLLILVSKISYCNDIDQELKRLFSDLQNSPYSPSTSTIRKEAIAELVKIGEPAVEPLLLNLNYSGLYGSNVRSGMIEALGKIGDERAIEPLIEILKTKFSFIGNRISSPPDKQMDMEDVKAAADALANIGEPAIEPLIRCMKKASESDDESLWHANRALTKIGKPAVKPLLDCLNNANSGLQNSIITILGDIRDVNAVESLTNCLKNPEIRHQAIVALGKLKDSRIIEPVLPYLISKNSNICRQAADTLEKLGYKPSSLEEQIDLIYAKRKYNELSALGEPAAEILLKRLDNDDINVRLNAAAALGHMKDERAIKYLEEFYDNPDKDISAIAFSALADMKNKELIPFFLSRMENLDWSAKGSLARVLEEIGYQPQTQEEQIDFLIAARKQEELIKIGAEAKEPLLDCLKDTSMRLMALSTLYKIGGEEKAEPYLLCLQDEDDAVRLSAISALEKMNYKPTVKEDEIIILLSKLHSDEELDKLGAESVEALIKCLNHQSSSISSRAADCLGRIGDKRAVEPLIECLHGEARRSAAEALGDLKDIRAVEPLIEQLNDQDMLRSVANALRKIGDKRVIQPLLACIEDKSPPYLPQVIYALEQLGYKPSSPEMQAAFELSKHDYFYDISPFGSAAIQPLTGLLRSYSIQVTDKVMESLVEIGKPSIEPLISSLKDSNNRVRKYIITILGKIGDDSATETLISFCLTDLSWEVRQEAAVSLGKIGNEKAVEALITCINKELNENVRKSAAESLGDIKNDKAINSLVICLDDPDKNVRQAAAMALDKIGYEQPNEKIQIQALISQMKWKDLVTIGSAAVEPLINCLKDNSPEIRLGAAESLGRIGDKRAIEPLISCFGDTSPQVRGAVAQALGNIGDEQAIEPLVKYLKQEKDNAARGKFIEALVKFGDEKVVSDIAECLPDWFNRVTILFALTRFGWQPVTNEQNVYLHIAATDKVWLDNNEVLVKQVLIVDANSYNAQKLEHSVYATLELGYEDLIPELVEIIRHRCNSEMAMRIQRCGDTEIEQAARAIMRRYDFMY